MYKPLILVLATSAVSLAAPADKRESIKQFRLGMEVKDTTVSLTATRNGTSGDIVLEAGRLSTVPGTLAWFIGAEPDLAIVFNVDESATQYGAKVVDVGKAPGNVHLVTAVADYNEFDFGFSVTDDGVITHELTGTTNVFMACEGTIDGVENYYLSWGNPSADAQLPEGCEVTTLKQI
ncbi:hypothetical protein B0I35DRAFT_484366 [Stachybotrys elegans]|uniref:Ubiquitin 3 binding protein But2 C-terminal domain-containing protein n=1 Tax=Stachybotrys elegans TaxID=80388 RepID=A0A8K0SI85_9HYPO|nr:hypothetical protein B0I35DRAFT_484366 [Stachybotrys elegans]